MALVIVREGQWRTTQSDLQTCESVKKDSTGELTGHVPHFDLAELFLCILTFISFRDFFLICLVFPLFLQVSFLKIFHISCVASYKD